MELKIVAERTGRLSSFLKGELKMSTGLMNRLKWGDAIRVNDTPQHTDFSVQPGDVISVRLDEPSPEYPPQQGELVILYEDDHILAVDMGVLRQQHHAEGIPIQPCHGMERGILTGLLIITQHKIGQCAVILRPGRVDQHTGRLIHRQNMVILV